MHSIYINDKEYKVKLAITDEEKEQGLQGVEKLPKDEGMLFINEKPEDVSYWMKDCPIDLDLIFIDEYGDVISVKEGIAESEDLIEEKNVKYVLELKSGSDIYPGDEVDLEEVEDYDVSDDDIDSMQVLDDDGNVQMELEGNERIFSRPNTKVLARLSKKAFKSKQDIDYKALGKKIFKFIEVQDERESEYVE